MMPTSRPLRAMGLVLGCWTAVRVVALWPAANVDAIVARDQVRDVFGLPAIGAPFDAAVARNALMAQHPDKMPPYRRHPELVSVSIARKGPVVSAKLWMLKQVQHDGADVSRGAQPPHMMTAYVVAPGLPAPKPRNRFSGSAWALMRSDSAPSLASGGQLGGSQIGMRLFYTPGPEALAMTARISAPLSQPLGREAAVGIALRGRNVGIIAEQRIALDKGGRDAPAVFAYGGVYDVRLPAGMKLDGYAQAGVVGLKSPAAFVDGAVRVERTVLHTENASLGIGAGAWGGAQPGVSRIDVGPQFVARIAVAETSLRVSAEWRQRVAGNAAPASGPSVTVGFDF